MAEVPRNMLESDLMCRSTNPISGVFTPISINVLIRFIRWGCLLWLIESHCISGPHWVVSGCRSCPFYYLFVDIPCSHAKKIVFKRYVACIPWQVLFIVWFFLLAEQHLYYYKKY